MGISIACDLIEPLILIDKLFTLTLTFCEQLFDALCLLGVQLHMFGKCKFCSPKSVDIQMAGRFQRK